MLKYEWMSNSMSTRLTLGRGQVEATTRTDNLRLHRLSLIQCALGPNDRRWRFHDTSLLFRRTLRCEK